VLALSVFGYHYTPPPNLAVPIPPTVVAGGLIVYNAVVVLVLGVPWRRRPGFGLFVVDWLVVTTAIVLTGGFFSPFLILYYAMVIGAALRLALPRSLVLVAACSLVYAWLSNDYPTPADTGAVHLPWLVVGITSLLMVAVTAVAMKRAVDIENTRARGVAVDPKSGHGFCSSSPVVMWDTKTLKPIKTIEVQGRPDGILFEPATERIYVFSHAAPNATVIVD